MSVVVRGMKMPTSCSECAFCGYYGKGDHVCDITGKEVVYELSLEGRLDDCPLVELPPHGRLIDADELTDRLERGKNNSIGQAHAYYRFAKAWVDEGKTVIEAEEGGGDHAEEV